MLPAIAILSHSSVLFFLMGVCIFLYALYKYRQVLLLSKKVGEEFLQLQKMLELERKDAFVKLKDDLYKKRKEFEIDLKRERGDFDRLQMKLNARYETLEKKEQHLEGIRAELFSRERLLQQVEEKHRVSEEKTKKLHEDLVQRLEQVSGLLKEEAKKELFKHLESEVVLSSQQWVQKIEDEARQSAKDRAIQIIITAMQRYTAQNVSQNSSSVVFLPDEDMKGKIIGKEGRNIKTFELATGTELVIWDTPEISVSSFNPIRREIAHKSLQRLISDGRINPTRIEETVTQCEKEVEGMIQDYGHSVILEFNLQAVHPDIVTLLGKLHFRTSFTQNVLEHSKEVGRFAQMIAYELGLKPEECTMALRAGLLHDIGKSLTAEIEGPHAILGGDVAKRCGENALVVNAIAAHHEEVAFESIFGPLIIIADTISASRPGARRETLSAYIKRLEQLEEIALTFEGIKRAYALQAGRELRILVEEDTLGDEQSMLLATNIAKKIESEMNFPGQIKVNVIREKRSIVYAR
jgi:ribonucrease Y